MYTVSESTTMSIRAAQINAAAENQSPGNGRFIISVLQCIVYIKVTYCAGISMLSLHILFTFLRVESIVKVVTHFFVL